MTDEKWGSANGEGEDRGGGGGERGRGSVKWEVGRRGVSVN